MAQSFSYFTKHFLVKTDDFIIRHPHLHRLSFLPRQRIRRCLLWCQTATAPVGPQQRLRDIDFFNVDRCFPHKLHLPAILRHGRLRTWWVRARLLMVRAPDRYKFRHLKLRLGSLGLARYIHIWNSNSLFWCLLQRFVVSSFCLLGFDNSFWLDFFDVLDESNWLKFLSFNKLLFCNLIFLFDEALDFIFDLWCCVLQMLQTVSCASFKSKNTHFAAG